MDVERSRSGVWRIDEVEGGGNWRLRCRVEVCGRGSQLDRQGGVESLVMRRWCRLRLVDLDLRRFLDPHRCRYDSPHRDLWSGL